MNIIRHIFTMVLSVFVLGILAPAVVAGPDRGPIAENTREIEKLGTDLDDVFKLSQAQATLMQQINEIIKHICIQAELQGLPPPPLCPNTSSNIVFASSTHSKGNMGGVQGANIECTALAHNAGFVGTFKAWLADDNFQPLDEFVHSSKPYVMPDNRVLGVGFSIIANDWDDLTDGTIQHRIDRTETGQEPPRSEAWTHTHHNGTRKDSTQPCNNWTSNGITNHNQQPPGSILSVDTFIGGLLFNDWTQNPTGPFGECFTERVIYCFQQVHVRATLRE